jgi:hypothetical protein
MVPMVHQVTQPFSETLNMSKKLENGELYIPIASPLPNHANGTPMPFVVVVVDEAFGLSKHVL